MTRSVRSVAVLTARIAAVTASLAVVTWLVVDAQRRANAPRRDEPAVADAPADARLLQDPVLPVFPSDHPIFDDPYLSSSKSVRMPHHAETAVPGQDPAAAVVPQVFLPGSKSGPAVSTPTFLHSSKTLTPLVMPVPPTLTFPPGTETATALTDPYLWSSKSGRPVTTQPFLPSSKSGKVVPPAPAPKEQPKAQTEPRPKN